MKLSIRLKLLIGFTILLLIASCVQAILFVLTKNYILDQIDSIQITEVNRGAGAIRNFVTGLNTYNQELAETYRDDPKSFSKAAKFLINSQNYIRKVTVLSRRGRELEKVDLFGNASSDKLSYEVGSEQFTEAAEGRRAYSKVYYSQKESAPYLDIYTPIISANATVAGVLKMKVNLHQVQEELADIKLGEHGFVYVVDDEGRLLAHNSEEYVLKRPNLSSRAIIANELTNKYSSAGDEQYVNENNIPVIAKAVKIPGLNWIAVLEQPRSEAFGFVTTLWNFFIFTLAVSMVLLLFVAFYLSGNLTRSIRKLQQSAQEIESGRSKEMVIIKSGDEIESLSKSFASVTNMLIQRDHWLERTTLELQEANSKLKNMDKLKDDFVSLASHELRTPMTAVKSYLSMALDGMGGKLTDKQRVYIDRAYVSSDRLIALVNDMLNISRIESGRLTITIKEVNLSKLVEEVIDDLRPRAAELGVTLEAQTTAPLPIVIADSDKIKEVFFNLIGNSLKFTPKGGKIVIAFNSTDTMVEVKITDTGMGIESENMPKLFQKFGLLSGASEQNALGTGLGLYICKSIIELHEGTIRAVSEGKDKGTQFIFTLKIFNEEDFQRLSEKYAHDESNTVDLVPNHI